MKFGGPPKGKGGGSGQDPPPGSVPARVGLVGVCLESVVVGVGPAGVGVMGSIHVNVTYLSYWKVYVNSPTKPSLSREGLMLKSISSPVIMDKIMQA